MRAGWQQRFGSSECPNSGAFAPVTNFFHTRGAGVLEQTHAMAGVLKFVDIGPDFSLQGTFMRRRFATSGAACVKRASSLRIGRGMAGEFDEDAAHFLNFFVVADEVLIAQQEIEPESPRLGLRFCAAMEGAILGPGLLG